MNNDIFKIQIPFKNWIFAGVQGLMFIFLLIPGALGISYFGMSESFSAVSFMEDSGFGAFAVVFLMLFFLAGIAYNVLVELRILKYFNLVNLALAALEFLFVILFMIAAATFEVFGLEFDLGVMSYLLLVLSILVALFATYLFLQDFFNGKNTLKELTTTKPFISLVFEKKAVSNRPAYGQQYQQPVQPQYQQPYGQPVQPQYQQPTAPAQPYGQPVQPQYQQPTAPVQPYAQPVQPQYQQPVAPAQPYAQPVQPQYQQPIAPAQPYGQPVQPQYQQPVAPAQPYAQPVQPQYQQPVSPAQPYAQPVQPQQNAPQAPYVPNDK